jgi:hypothetical protein
VAVDFLAQQDAAVARVVFAKQKSVLPLVLLSVTPLALAVRRVSQVATLQ